MIETDTTQQLSQINGNNDKNNRDERYSGAELRIALDQSLDILGRSVTEAIIEEMAKNGIDLGSKTSSYSIAQIERQFEEMFGEDASQLLVERIKDYFRSKKNSLG